MGTLKKTIILNNNTVKNFNGMATLTLNKEQSYVYATFKAFNLNIKDNLVLAIAQNKKQITKQNISLINNNTYNFKINNLNLDEPISCVLVSNEKTEVIPIVWAGENKNLNTEIMKTFEELKQETFVKTVVAAHNEEKKEKLDLSEMCELPTSEELEGIITEELNNSLDDISTEELNPIDEELKNINLGDETFYESMSDQIEELFNKYPSEPNLEKLIPNSKWVKIDYENNGNYYVLGLIYEDIELKYIAYGVPGTFSENAPNGLNNYSQWLPTNPESPNDFGYWVMYQNALSGESVEIDAI